MISLTIRSYEGETDFQAISDLLNACEAVDELNQWTSVSELRQASDDPSLDKAPTKSEMGIIEEVNGYLS